MKFKACAKSACTKHCLKTISVFPLGELHVACQNRMFNSKYLALIGQQCYKLEGREREISEIRNGEISGEREGGERNRRKRDRDRRGRDIGKRGRS